MKPAITELAKATKNDFPFRVRRQAPKVRPHETGRWTINIGKKVNKTGKRLRPADFYFKTTEAAANAQAQKIADKWAFIVKHWPTMYGKTLRIIGSAFADTPHWQPALGTRPDPTIAEIAEQSEPTPTADEMAEAHGDISLDGVFGLYKIELQKRIADGDAQNTTIWTTEKNIRCALRFFDNTKMRFVDLNAAIVGAAKSAMLAKLGRRAASNYLTALRGMIKWWYGSAYGRGWDRPSNFDRDQANEFDKAFLVKKKTTTKVGIPSLDDIAAILPEAVKHDGLPLLAALLALNCGMYAADIGRLTLSEINLADGYVFWDREKQPDNEFRVAHRFWPETLAVVKRFIQPGGRPARPFIDYRHKKPIEIDCASLAFVDAKGLPLYRVRETGKSYDKIEKAWRPFIEGLGEKKKPQPRFMNLRKATNQILKDHLVKKFSTEDRGEGINEISKQFLGQKTPELQQVYEIRGVGAFDRMNKYLAEVGSVLRKAGAFKGIRK